MRSFARGLALLGLVACGGTDPDPGVKDAGGGSDVPMVVDAGVDKVPDTVSATDRPAADGLAPDVGGDDLPAACRVAPTTLPQPFQVTFHLKNPGSTPLYLRQACAGIELSIASCGSRYTDSVGPGYACACSCADSGCNGQVACGPCPTPEGIAVAPAGTKDVAWIASLITPEARPGYICNRSTHLPAARYSVTVPVFATALEAASGQPVIRFASRIFELPAPGNVVELLLGDQPTDAGVPLPTSCHMPPAQPPAVCAPPWDPATVCALDTTYTLGRTGGLVARYDQAQVTPIGGYTISRYASGTTTPALVSCKSQLPLCGADQATFTSANLMEALTAPDVAAAFASPPFMVHGGDARAYDGQVLSVARADGKGLLVGTPCGASGQPCSLPLTAGLQHLADLFAKIDQQQRATPACAVLATP